ncbi:hypothetical protein [Chakrabartyella piscis]|uniref:hypothetical protein n=1 Tax=Chakrabartyella piscis TaxID=2918914 RepID=UPI0029584797|nr:hypothetical protein [Chakrabartyella piscis]
MKNKLILLLVVAFSVFFVACGGEEPVADNADVSIEEEAVDVETEIAEVASDEVEPEDTEEPNDIIEQRADANFRNVYWGDSVEDVMAIETDAEYVGL